MMKTLVPTSGIPRQMYAFEFKPDLLYIMSTSQPRCRVILSPKIKQNIIKY